MHVFHGSWLSRPDFELTCSLMHEHFRSGNYLDALGPRHLQQPCFCGVVHHLEQVARPEFRFLKWRLWAGTVHAHASGIDRSEEHTSELQSRFDLVCRLLLEKKNNFYSS